MQPGGRLQSLISAPKGGERVRFVFLWCFVFGGVGKSVALGSRKISPEGFEGRGDTGKGKGRAQPCGVLTETAHRKGLGAGLPPKS